ncbi:MAG: transglycosylase SLT domain-containing protein [Acidobacteria bacterium]|nr:transglycosylase SLT domain-containing protein [Acidobacteriota bacterium]
MATARRALFRGERLRPLGGKPGRSDRLAPAHAEHGCRLGCRGPFDPAQNIAAGSRHLRWLYDLFDEVPEQDRLAFALAAYNFGLGHLEDARQLAAERGLDVNRWAGHVETVLPLLEDESIAAGLRHGGARGNVTLRYVTHVLGVYRSFSDKDAIASAALPISGS